MASETTTTTADDLFIAAQFDRMVLEEIRPRNVTRPLMRYAKLTESKSYSFPIQNSPGAAGSSTEGTGLSNTALSTDKSTATAGTVGQQATITDELSAISIVDAYSQFSGVLTRSVLAKYETDFTALVNNFSRTVSTSGVAATVDTFLQAVAALVQNDIPGPYCAVLHPKQTTDIQRDMATSLAAQYGKDNAPDPMSITDAGYQYTIGQVPIYQCSLVPTANAGVDRAGGVFVQKHTLGLAETWDVRTETIRVPALPGTQVDVTANYGVVEIKRTTGSPGSDGVTMITKA